MTHYLTGNFSWKVLEYWNKFKKLLERKLISQEYKNAKTANIKHVNEKNEENDILINWL